MTRLALDLETGSSSEALSGISPEQQKLLTDLQEAEADFLVAYNTTTSLDPSGARTAWAQARTGNDTVVADDAARANSSCLSKPSPDPAVLGSTGQDWINRLANTSQHPLQDKTMAEALTFLGT